MYYKHTTQQSTSCYCKGVRPRQILCCVSVLLSGNWLCPYLKNIRRRELRPTEIHRRPINNGPCIYILLYFHFQRDYKEQCIVWTKRWLHNNILQHVIRTVVASLLGSVVFVLDKSTWFWRITLQCHRPAVSITVAVFLGWDVEMTTECLKIGGVNKWDTCLQSTPSARLVNISITVNAAVRYRTSSKRPPECKSEMIYTGYGKR